MLPPTHVCVVCEGGVCAAVPGVGGHSVVSAVLPPRHGAARTSDHVDPVIQLVSNRAESAIGRIRIDNYLKLSTNLREGPYKGTLLDECAGRKW